MIMCDNILRNTPEADFRWTRKTPIKTISELSVILFKSQNP